MTSDWITRDFDGHQFVRVCRTIEVSGRTPKRIDYDLEHDLALFRIDGTVYAISNVCPHKRESVLYVGFVEGDTVTCPLHGRQYNVKSGQNVGQGRGINTYPVIEAEGYVWVNIQGARTPTISP